MDGSTIVAEPMSTIPTGISPSPTKHSLAFHPKPPPEAIKPNPHPYPIRTTSTGLLSRSNSTANSSAAYQYYVPQSPGSPGGASKGNKERRGGRHRYSKSLNSGVGPTPFPVPPGIGSEGAAYRERNASSSSLSSTGGDDNDGDHGGGGGGGGGGGDSTGTGTRTGEAVDVDVFGQVENNTIARPSLSRRRKIRAGTMPSSSAATFGWASTDGDRVVDPDPDLDKRRGRTGHTMGGKVKGIVASFERGGGGGDYGRRRARFRSGSAASDNSISSSSSFSSSSSGSFDGNGVEEGAVEIHPTAASDRDTSQTEATSTSDTPKRNQDNPKEEEADEPTMEQLLASTSSSVHTYASTGMDTIRTDDKSLNIETVKLRDIYSDTIVRTRGESDIRMPNIGPLPPAFGVSSIPKDLNDEKMPRSKLSDAGYGEMTVEELLACFHPISDDNAGAGRGADAWEKDIGSTAKRIGIDNGAVSKGGLDMGRGEIEKRRLEDLFAPNGKDEKREAGVVEAPVVPPPPPPPPLLLMGPQPTSPVISEKEVKIEQEMKETREMVCALSARVADVEIRIGEMERVAGELEMRGRMLVEGEGTTVGGVSSGVSGGNVVVVVVEGDSDEPTADLDPSQTPGQSVARYSMRSVVGVAWSVVDRAFEGAYSRWARMLPFSSSSTVASGTAFRRAQSSEVSGSQSTEIPAWYKKSWTCYLLFLGLGACAFVLREVVRRGMMLRGRVGVGAGRR